MLQLINQYLLTTYYVLEHNEGYIEVEMVPVVRNLEYSWGNKMCKQSLNNDAAHKNNLIVIVSNSQMKGLVSCYMSSGQV